jgi:hypothetical protein
MVATVAAGADAYHNTVNTLKYADRWGFDRWPLTIEL